MIQFANIISSLLLKFAVWSSIPARCWVWWMMVIHQKEVEVIIHKTLQSRLLHIQNWCADCTDAAKQINFHYGELISANLVMWNVLFFFFFFFLEYSGILALDCKTTIPNAFLSMLWVRLEIASKNVVWTTTTTSTKNTTNSCFWCSLCAE